MNQNLFNKLTELYDTTPLETDMLEIINAYEKDKAEQSLQGDIMGNCYQCNSSMQYPTIAGYCSVKCAEEALNNESNIPKTSNPLVIGSLPEDATTCLTCGEFESHCKCANGYKRQ